MDGKFQLGLLLVTEGAMNALYREAEFELDLPVELMMVSIVIFRHAQGEWGPIPEEDKALNERALVEGGRLMSAFILPSTKVMLWVITEADRKTTTLLLPDEY